MAKKSQARISLYKKIWCKIRCYQQLYDMSDKDLSNYLCVSERTLKEYDKNAMNITLGKLDNFLYINNLTLIELLNI